MGERVSPTASNNEVISVLRKELASVANNSFNVLATRIDRFGVVAPNIQRLERAERILVELPGITEPKRVRNLLQGSANLEFWKTYNVSELGTFFNDLNARSAEYAMAQRMAATDTDSTLSVDPIAQADSLALTDSVSPTAMGTEALTAEVLEEEKVEITKSFVEYFNEPYFAMRCKH